MIRAFLADESGATAVEYGVLAAVIALALLGAMATLGGGVERLYNKGIAELFAAKAASIS